MNRAEKAVGKFYAGATGGSGDAFVAYSAYDIARAALSAALDLTEAERKALYDNDDNIGARIFNEGVNAAIAALKSSCASDQVQDVQSCPPQENGS